MTPLEKSIEHWKENVAARRPSQASTSGMDCALCDVYCINAGTECEGCPVALATGKPNCDNSPFWDCPGALLIWSENPNNTEWKNRFTRAAQAELDFLISLLPETPDDTPSNL